MWISRVTHETHSSAWHHPLICVTWLIHTCDMTHSYVWHDSFHACEWVMSHMRLIHMCLMTHSYVWHDSFIRVAWRIHMCTRLIPTCDMTHSYVWHGLFIFVAWLIHMSDMADSCVWHDTHSIIQGGEDPQDASSCRSFFAKEPRIIGLFCGKCPIKTRHPMTLHHPVWVMSHEPRHASVCAYTVWYSYMQHQVRGVMIKF